MDGKIPPPVPLEEVDFRSGTASAHSPRAPATPSRSAVEEGARPAPLPHIQRPDLPLGGRLSAFRPVWQRDLHPQDRVVPWIQSGVPLADFAPRPPPDSLAARSRRNLRARGQHFFTGPEATWFEQHLQELLAMTVVEEVRDPEEAAQTVLSPLFLVPKPGPRAVRDEYRLIIDMRLPNRYLQAPRTRLADLRTLRWLLFAGRWMASIDVTKAYYHIPLRACLARLCGFAYRGRTYRFLVVPFGLTVAPYIMTQVMRASLRVLRKKHLLHVTAYLDDLLIVGRTPAATRAAVRTVADHLTHRGWVLSLDKSHVEPTQYLEYLGLGVDLRPGRGSLVLPKAKQSRLLSTAKSMSRLRRWSLTEVLRAVGYVVSCLAAVPALQDRLQPTHRWVARLRRLQPWRASPRGQGVRDLLLPARVRATWLAMGDWVRRKTRQGPLSAPLVDLSAAGVTLMCDASRRGWGGAWPAAQRFAQGRFTRRFLSGDPRSPAVSTTELELYGLLQTVKAARGWLLRRGTGRESVASCSTCSLPVPADSRTCSLCAGSPGSDTPSSSPGTPTGSKPVPDRTWQSARPPPTRVTVLCDALSVVHMMRRGTTRSEPCSRLRRRIQRLVRQENWALRVHWLPTEANRTADALSRVFTRGGEPGFHPLDARLQLEQAGRDGDASRPARQHSGSSGVSSARLEKMFLGWRQEESFLRAFASGIAPELFLGSSRHPLQMLLGATETDRWLWPPAGQVPLVVRWALHDSRRRTWVIAPGYLVHGGCPLSGHTRV